MTKTKQRREREFFVCKNSDHVDTISALQRAYKLIPNIIDELNKVETSADYNECFYKLSLIEEELEAAKLNLTGERQAPPVESKTPYKATVFLIKIARATLTTLSRELIKKTEATTVTNWWVAEQLESAVGDIEGAESELPNPPTLTGTLEPDPDTDLDDIPF